jgi:hypothetical protein
MIQLETDKWHNSQGKTIEYNVKAAEKVKIPDGQKRDGMETREK